MRNFPTKRLTKNRRGWLYSKPILVILVVLVFFLGRATWDVYGKFSLARDSLRQTQTEEQILLEQKNTLTGLVEKLNTRRGVEEVIRRNLPVVKPGEQMIMVMDEETKKDQLELTEPELTSEDWWNRLQFWRD